MSINWKRMQVLTTAAVLAGLPISTATADGHLGGYVAQQLAGLSFRTTGNGVELAVLWGNPEPVRRQ